MSADATWSKACREKSAEPIVVMQYTALRRGESKDTKSMKFTEAKSEDRKSEKKTSCPRKDKHGMRKDNWERLLAEDE